MAVIDAFISLICLFTVLFTEPHCIFADTSVTLTTTLGEVNGVRKSEEVDAFLGIPYAQPPINDLRFRAPVAATPWTGVLDGTAISNSCWQVIDPSFDNHPGVQMLNVKTPRSEDCLYLNVWRPANMTTNPKTIMIYIHGGAFMGGGTSLDVYDGTYMASYKDVIVVTINYRLGPFGFLYLGTDEVPGNAGLLDQVMALQWVKDNAVNLGGSPDDISIFGESAGAASVGLHLFSPLSQDIFQYAIMESASPFEDWAVMDTDKAKERSLKLAGSIYCSSSSDEELLKCLQNANPIELTYLQFVLAESWFDFPLGPVVDNNFLPDHPKALLERGEVKNTSVILGINTEEGIIFTVYAFSAYYPLEGDGQITEDQCNIILQTMAEDSNKNHADVQSEYSQMIGSNATYADVVSEVSSDLTISCGVVEFAEMYAKAGGQVYLYSMEQRLSTNPWPIWMGVPHTFELEIVFGHPLATDSAYTEEEKTLSMKVMDYWINLVKTGNPNGAENDWPLYTVEGGEYKIIDCLDSTQGQYLRHDECAFWNN